MRSILLILGLICAVAAAIGYDVLLSGTTLFHTGFHTGWAAVGFLIGAMASDAGWPWKRGG